MENIIDQKVEKLQNILVQGLSWRSSPGIPIQWIHFETRSKLPNRSRLRNQTWKSGLAMNLTF